MEDILTVAQKKFQIWTNVHNDVLTIQPAVDSLLVLAIAYYFHPETLVHQIGNRTLEELLQIAMSWKKEPYWVTIAKQTTSKKELQLYRFHDQVLNKTSHKGPHF